MNKFLVLCGVAFQAYAVMAADVMFDERDREIFACEESRVFDKYASFFDDKEINEASFNQLCTELDNERRNIAILCAADKGQEALKETCDFGSLRVPVLDETPYATPLVSKENKVLYEIYNKFFSTWLRGHPVPHSQRVFSKHWGNDVLKEVALVRNSMGGLTFGQSDNATVFTKQLRNCREVSVEKITALYAIGRVSQIKFTETAELDGMQVPISTICGLIEMGSDLKITESAINDLQNHASYLIHHVAVSSIAPLMNQAFLHWYCAMHCYPQYVPGVFLKEISLCYWFHSQAAPTKRGSEARLKWLVELAARHHDYTIVYPEDYVFRLPFGLSRDDFASHFITHVRVERLGGDV